MHDELTPRERVLLAVSHQQTDRVPVDFRATPETWAPLQEHLGIDRQHPRQPYVGPPLGYDSAGSWVDACGVRHRTLAGHATHHQLQLLFPG